jgi:glyoxylase-like metal-dependent hydrolase (beta-lactamase superfamily II)
MAPAGVGSVTSPPTCLRRRTRLCCSIRSCLRTADTIWTALDALVAQKGAPNVLLTIYWHARSSPAILERYAGTRVWVHEPAADEMRKRVAVTDTFRPGSPLPGGVEAIGVRHGEILFWLANHRALVAGDVLLGANGGVRICPDSWLGTAVTPKELRAELGELLARPIELVLLTHGGPVENGQAALTAALG